jgi:hypothetical protein
MPKVTTAESKPVRVAKFLTERGFTSRGLMSPPGSDKHGCSYVFISSMTVQKKFLWWTWSAASSFMPATLYLSEPDVGANDKNWVMHVKGRKIFGRMRDIAVELSAEFNVDIHVRLEQEEYEYPLHRPHGRPAAQEGNDR